MVKSGYKIFQHLVTVTVPLHCPALVVIAGISAQRSKGIRSQGDESCKRCTPCHVFDVGIQATIFMYDNNSGKRAAGSGRMR